MFCSYEILNMVIKGFNRTNIPSGRYGADAVGHDGSIVISSTRGSFSVAIGAERSLLDALFAFTLPKTDT